MKERKLDNNKARFSLSKEDIIKLKQNDNKGLISLVKDNLTNSNSLVFILEHLGHLPSNFDYSWLVSLTTHDNENVRLLAVKNLAKQASVSNIELLSRILANDKSSMVKREAVSAIGRMRATVAIPYLIKALADEDPKIVCQAIRGLLVFKGDKIVDKSLKKLKNHENELVRNIVSKEFFAKRKNKLPELRHTETYHFLENVVVNGDVRDVLKFVPDESIHLTFTSPPYYNARDYSIYPSYEKYLRFLEEVFRETFRITKEGRFLIVNTSPVIIPRISRAHSSKRYPIPFDLHYYLVNMGWEFIDDIIWEKPEYSVKNRIGGFQQHRKPLAYKPNSITEYLMVYRKKTDRLIDWNIHQYDSNIVEESKVKDGFETTNVWKIAPKSDKIHSAIFPVDLCKRVIEYYSFKGDIVFDPFAGSGTLGRTAKSLDRKFFLTEKEVKYFEYMKTLQSKDKQTKGDVTKFFTLEQFKNSLQ